MLEVYSEHEKKMSLNAEIWHFYAKWFVDRVYFACGIG